MKRTPMKRTAWLRTTSTTAKSKPNRAQRPEEHAQSAMKNGAVCDPVKTAGKRSPALIPSMRVAIKYVAINGTTAARPQAKSVAHLNSHLRAMARGMPCLLRVQGVCTQDSSTVVCCHSNLGIHGKAGARKADDEYSVWGCAACHRWLDQGPAPRARKESAFMAAHLRQVLAWRAIAMDGESAKDRAAAQWALALLNALPHMPPEQSIKGLEAIKSGANA